ncbi:MAG: Mur ligase family protein [Actinomycetota bacterium]
MNGSDTANITFGETSEAHVRASDIEIREGRAHFDLVTPEGREAVALRLIGEHQVANATGYGSCLYGTRYPH